ncbi:MAG TPA: ABC transporter ATP-binding protein [Verrucomicrobiae bacterium]|nr:ABC transporter ATP-binding protein [Verrucomicrobiae bacterium]
MIETKELTKMYDATHGISEVTLAISNGTSMSLLGRNGAGKTTLIRTLLGLLKPNSGGAIINGIDVVTDAKDVRKIIGYLPEAFGLYNDMTVTEILDYAAKLERIETTERMNRIRSLLERLDLTEIKDMKAGNLSKGLSQKVGFARALLNDPQVIFLDEPTSGLDPVAARTMENLVNDLKHEGKTLLITSHILPEVEKMCDHVSLIKKGHLLASGTLDEVKSKYCKPAILIRLADEASAKQAVTLLKKNFKEPIDQEDNKIIVQTNNPDEVTASVNKKLEDANLAVYEIKKQDSSLDDVYFKAMEE